MLNQDKKIDFEKRKSRPQTLAAAFGGLVDLFGGRSSDADLVKNWKNIVDSDIYDIANVIAVKPNKNKKINVVLRPVSPAFALELSYKIEKCKTQINKYYGRDTVDKIIIRK